jgi:acyl transferase domain-containing protein
MQFPSEPTTWPHTSIRRASVSSFGFGGSNSHAVLKDAYHHLQEHGLSANPSTVIPSSNARSLADTEICDKTKGTYLLESTGSTSQLIIFSAASKSTLETLLANYSQHLSRLCLTTEELAKYVQDLAFTLGTRRSRLSCRAFAILGPETLRGDLISVVHRAQHT